MQNQNDEKYSKRYFQNAALHLYSTGILKSEIDPELKNGEKSLLVDIEYIECKHEWKSYQGLNKMFNFCSKCDKKDVDNS